MLAESAEPGSGIDKLLSTAMETVTDKLGAISDIMADPRITGYLYVTID